MGCGCWLSATSFLSLLPGRRRGRLHFAHPFLAQHRWPSTHRILTHIRTLYHAGPLPAFIPHGRLRLGTGSGTRHASGRSSGPRRYPVRSATVAANETRGAQFADHPTPTGFSTGGIHHGEANDASLTRLILHQAVWRNTSHCSPRGGARLALHVLVDHHQRAVARTDHGYRDDLGIGRTHHDMEVRGMELGSEYQGGNGHQLSHVDGML